MVQLSAPLDVCDGEQLRASGDIAWRGGDSILTAL